MLVDYMRMQQCGEPSMENFVSQRVIVLRAQFGGERSTAIPVDTEQHRSPAAMFEVAG